MGSEVSPSVTKSDTSPGHAFICPGINQWDVDVPPRYLSSTHLAARVGNLNPRWNEDSSAERTDAQFQKAVQLTGSEFLESVDYLAKVNCSSDCTLTHRHVLSDP